MRRLVLAALVGTFVLTGCSDQSRPTGPTEVRPSMDATPTCDGGTYPGVLPAINAQIEIVFEPQSRNPASNKVATISNLFTKRNFKDATKQTFQFLDWLGQRQDQGKVIGTVGDVTKLSSMLFCALGAAGPTLPPGLNPNSPDVGIGYYDPNSKTPTLVRTNNTTAGTQIQPGTFLDPDTHQPVTQTVTITIFRLPDFPGPLNTGLSQFPPFWEFNAALPDGRAPDVNLSNPAVVGLCISTNHSPPPEAVIGHNIEPDDFELLPLVTVPFALSCSNVTTTEPPIGLSPMHGMWGLASVFTNAHRGLSHLARTVFLPEQAWATLVGEGTIGGTAGHYSPFGAVDPSSNQNGFNVSDDPGSEYTPLFVNEIFDSCQDECWPRVDLEDPNGNTLQGTNPITITASLVKLSGTGNLAGTTTVVATPGENMNYYNTVRLMDLSVTAPGTYQLRLSAPGFRTYTSEPFDVYRLSFTQQPGSHNELELLGQTGLDSFPVVQVSALDKNNSVVTTVNGIPIEILPGNGFGGNGPLLHGNNTADLTNGRANFTATYFDGPGLTDGLYVEGPGTGLTLEARRETFTSSPTAEGQTQTESAPFNISSP